MVDDGRKRRKRESNGMVDDSERHYQVAKTNDVGNEGVENREQLDARRTRVRIITLSKPQFLYISGLTWNFPFCRR